jgi:hypothetical protein
LPQVVPEQYEALAAAIHAHDHLRRIVDAVENHHRLVFHANDRVDWSQVRQSAEQILMAEIVTRHKGNVDGVYFALRAAEAGGKPWNVAIQDLGATIHSYFTTPLGVLMRRDLFGEQAAFIAADAYDWIRQRESARAARAEQES